MESRTMLCVVVGIVLLVCQAQAVLLWEDDFEAKNIEERWTRGGGAGEPSGWKITRDKAAKSSVIEIFPNVEQLDGRGQSSFALGKEVFTNFAYVVDIQVVSTPFIFNIGLLFRTSGGGDLNDNFYELELLPTGFTRTPNTINWIRRNGGWNKTTKMDSADIPIPFLADQWYQIMIVAEENNLSAYIKKGLVQGGFVLIDKWTDEDSLNLEGTLGFHMVSWMHYLIDNVRVFDTAMDAFSFYPVASEGNMITTWGKIRIGE